MKKILISLFLSSAFVASFAISVSAASPSPVVSATPQSTTSPSPTVTPVPTPRIDITQKSEESLGPLEAVLKAQQLGPLSVTNVFKYAIRNAVAAGVPANTVVLLLLLPLIAAIIAAARHLIGLRGFGIFLPAALSVVFLALGPFVGILLFLVIIAASTIIRVLLRRLRVRLQYLPRMAMLLWFVVLAVLAILFAAPILQQPGLNNVSIFPVLILVLLAEDFTKVQMGKNAKTAINLTTETLILALVSFIFLTWQGLQIFALLNPEVFLVSIFIFDYLIGKYVGLRFMEYWRFRKLISS